MTDAHSPSSTVRWSPWQPLPLQLTATTLAETLDGGQSFRWKKLTDDTWQGIWAGSFAQIRHQSDGSLAWSAPLALQARVAQTLPAYLRTRDDFTALADTLPWRSDPHLARCLSAFPGLRIPRQPFGETLLCFLCSATKQIVQIKEMVALLAQNHGQLLFQGGDVSPTRPRTDEPSVLTLNSLPTWETLATIPEDVLRRCLLGFRARYIAATARYLAERPGWLDETEGLPYVDAKARLLELPGVGAKVADCVLLFGAGQLEAFPVDTWILKAMAHRYGLTDWKPAQIVHFGRQHFGPLAGLAQQYLFAYERQQSRSHSVVPR